MHIDLNAFFASAEELRHPELKDKPIIICNESPRGVVSTASYEARKYGIHSAMPYFEAKRLCPNGVFIEPDFKYYTMLSHSFFSFLKNYSLLIEEASIDEGYVDMTDACKNLSDPMPYFEGIRDKLLETIGLKCSIGVAPTKFLAKMASDIKKPMGVTIIRRKDLKRILYPLPIESFFGIGKKSSAKLKEMGIYKIRDLKERMDSNEQELSSFFGKGYLTIKEDINGFGDDLVNPLPLDPKSLGHSETFQFDTNDEDFIKSKLRELSYEVSEGVKKDKKVGKTVVLVIKDAEFKAHNKSITLTNGTSDPYVIYSNVASIYERNYLGMMIRLIGVTLQNLYNARDIDIQMDLWNFQEYEKQDKTKLLVNELNRKMKKPSLKMASEVKKNGNK